MMWNPKCLRLALNLFCTHTELFIWAEKSMWVRAWRGVRFFVFWTGPTSLKQPSPWEWWMQEFKMALLYPPSVFMLLTWTDVSRAGGDAGWVSGVPCSGHFPINHAPSVGTPRSDTPPSLSLWSLSPCGALRRLARCMYSQINIDRSDDMKWSGTDTYLRTFDIWSALCSQTSLNNGYSVSFVFLGVSVFTIGQQKGEITNVLHWCVHNY